MDKVDFSIIVPAYNAAKYADSCCGSLLAQTYPDFEILLEDDGSTDNTCEAWNKLAAGDKRLIVSRNTHTGYASTMRNTGIRHATKKYVMFVDSDDTIKNDTLARIASAIVKNGFPDILTGGLTDGKNERHVLAEADGVISGKQAMEQIHLAGKTLACNSYIGVFKREFLLKNALFQRDDLTLYEDNEWFPRVMFKAEKIAGLDYAFYNYVRHERSITTGLSEEKLSSVAKAVAYMTIFFEGHKKGMTLELKRFFANHALNAFMWYYFNPMYSKYFTLEQKRSVFTRNITDKRAFYALFIYVSNAKKIALIPIICALAGFYLPAKIFFSFFYSR